MAGTWVTMCGLQAGRCRPKLALFRSRAVDAREGAGGTGAFSANANAATSHVFDRSDDAFRGHQFALDLEATPDHRPRPAVDENQALNLAGRHSGKRLFYQVRNVAVVAQSAIVGGQKYGAEAAECVEVEEVPAGSRAEQE